MSQLGTFSNSGLSFGVAFTLEDGFTAVSNQINQSMDRMGGATDRIADRMNASFGRIQAGMGLITTGLSLAAPIGLGVKYAGEFEQGEIALTTLLKSAEQAKAVFGQIKSDAAATPFETKDLLAGNIALISTGMSADKARKDILNLGNAIAGSGKGTEELQRMTSNMQQIANLGEASAADIKQFGYAGINIYGLLADATGKSVDEVKKMPVTYDLLSAALEKAAQKGGLYEGAMERQSKSINGKFSTLSDGVQFSMAKLGEAVMPVLHPLLDMINGLLEKFVAFAETGLGKAVIYIAVTVIGLIALTVVGVGVVLVVQALSAAVGTLLIEILPIVLLVLLFVAALWGLYEAINSNNKVLVVFGTLILIGMGPLGVLAAAILFVVRAKREFDAYFENPMPLDKYTPVQQFFIKFGAILKAIGEMFMFSNAKDGIGMTEELTRALDKMGLLETARNIGTWIVRLKEMWAGLKEGLKAGWETLKSVWNAVSDTLSSAMDKLGIIDGGIGKTTSSMEKWREVGKWVGYILIGVFAAIIIILASMAIAMAINAVLMIISFLPVIITVGLIIAVIWAIIWLINNWGMVWDSICNWIAEKWNGLLEWFSYGISWLLSLPAYLFDMGVQMVQNMWDGMASMWDGFVGWIDSMITALIDKVLGFFSWIGEKAGQVWDAVTGGGDDEDGGPKISPSGNTSYGNAPNIGNRMARNQGAKAAGSQPVVLNNHSKSVESITLNTYLDGEPIHKNVMDRNQLKEARKNNG